METSNSEHREIVGEAAREIIARSRAVVAEAHRIIAEARGEIDRHGEVMDALRETEADR
jgi:hypothetical protein